MQITVSVIGIFEGKPLQFREAVSIDDNLTVEKLFKKLDKEAKPSKRFFRLQMSSAKPPTVMLNGIPLREKADLKRVLRDGDQISVLSSIAGG